MSLIGNSINQSATISVRAGADIGAGAGLAVKFDKSGNLVLCSAAGESALGILLMQEGAIKSGDDVSVQIKDAGTAVSGGAIACGDMVSAGADGRVIKAQSGYFILGVALGACGSAGAHIPLQIAKCGFMQ